MGILKRLFGKIEEVNKGEAALEELDQTWTINLEEEANDFWFQMEQNLLIILSKHQADWTKWSVLSFLSILSKAKKPLNCFIK